MELDDLKKQWKATPTPAVAVPDAILEAIQNKIPMFTKTGRHIRRAFVIEMIIVGFVYLFFFLTMWFLYDSVEAYMYKIIITTSVATIPIIWRLYKSQRWVNSMDYTVDVRTNIVAFVRYYKKTLLLYEWVTYIIVLVITVMLFVDEAFRALPLNVKAIFIGYVIIIVFFTRPYIRYMYGRKIAVFEDFLKD